MNQHVKDKLFSTIHKEIGRDPAELDPDKPIRDQIALDSMQFVSLVARIELALNLELPISAMEVNTLNEFLTVIDETVGPNASTALA